jgi:hypothetical protein
MFNVWWLRNVTTAPGSEHATALQPPRGGSCLRIRRPLHTLPHRRGSESSPGATRADPGARRLLRPGEPPSGRRRPDSNKAQAELSRAVRWSSAPEGGYPVRGVESSQGQAKCRPWTEPHKRCVPEGRENLPSAQEPAHSTTSTTPLQSFRHCSGPYSRRAPRPVPSTSGSHAVTPARLACSTMT